MINTCERKKYVNIHGGSWTHATQKHNGRKNDHKMNKESDFDRSKNENLILD